MQEQPIEGTTSSSISKDDLTPSTAREEPLITEPLLGIEVDVKMQDQSVVNESTPSKSVSSIVYFQTRHDLIYVPQRSRNPNHPTPP